MLLIRRRCKIKYGKINMKKKPQGFTVVEVASVTALVSVVAALSYPLITNLIARTEYAAAKLALASLHKKCEAINMLGVSGTGEKVNIRGYKIKSSFGYVTEMSKLCKSNAIVFISNKEKRPSLYYNIRKSSSGCLVSGKHLNSYPECSSKEQTTFAQAINRAGNLMKTGKEDYYSFSSSGTGGGDNNSGGGGRACDKNNDPECE